MGKNSIAMLKLVLKIDIEIPMIYVQIWISLIDLLFSFYLDWYYIDYRKESRILLFLDTIISLQVLINSPN